MWYQATIGLKTLSIGRVRTSPNQIKSSKFVDLVGGAGRRRRASKYSRHVKLTRNLWSVAILITRLERKLTRKEV